MAWREAGCDEEEGVVASSPMRASAHAAPCDVAQKRRVRAPVEVWPKKRRFFAADLVDGLAAPS